MLCRPGKSNRRGTKGLATTEDHGLPIRIYHLIGAVAFPLLTTVLLLVVFSPLIWDAARCEAGSEAIHEGRDEPGLGIAGYGERTKSPCENETPTLEPTPSLTATSTPLGTPTPTASHTATPTPTPTPTGIWLWYTSTPTNTGTPPTATHTPTCTRPPTATHTRTYTPTPRLMHLPLIMRLTPPPTATSTATPTVYGVLCTGVTDGDTIELVTGQRVRYIGIDAPESGDCYAVEAASKNRELVEGKMVRLERDMSEDDRYGRLLRYVYAMTPLGEFMVNGALVLEGYALVITVPPDVKYASWLLQLEEEAQRAGRGLWGACPTLTPTATSAATATATRLPMPPPTNTPIPTPTSRR